MASFSPIRGTRAQISATPIVDGQFLIETDSSGNNKIYIDNSTDRRVVGGGSGLLPHVTIIAPSGTTVSDITVTGTGGSTIIVTPVSGSTFEFTADNFGDYIVTIGSNSQTLEIDCVNEYTIEYNSTSNVWTIIKKVDSNEIIQWISDSVSDATSKTLSDSRITTTTKIACILGDNGTTTPVKYSAVSVGNGYVTITFPVATTATIDVGFSNV